MTTDFIKNRITELRLRKGVSEYQMSYDLGKSRGYIFNISSGRSIPPLKELLSICDYFEITPSEFFNEGTHYPELVTKAITEMQTLSDDDLLLILNMISRLTKK